LTSKNKNLAFLVDGDCDFNVSLLLKKIEKLYHNVKFFSFFRTNSLGNFYFSGSFDRIQDIQGLSDLCITFSINLKKETPVLNSRFRVHCQNSLLNFYSIGEQLNSNLPLASRFISLNKSLKKFEGKYFFLSKELLTSKSAMSLFGDSSSLQMSNLQGFAAYLKFVVNSSKFLRIGSFSNTESSRILNIKNVNTRFIDLTDVLLTFNIGDCFEFRRYFSKLIQDCIWFNSHGSLIALSTKLIAPTLTEFEEERTIINLEGRPQRTQKIFDSFFNGRSLLDILTSSFFNSSNATTLKEASAFGYLTESVQNPTVFDSLKKSNFVCSVSSQLDTTLGFISKYPNKMLVEDFYCSNKASRNSKAMLQSSQELRKFSSNFETGGVQHSVSTLID
jgi:hypothetical protein